MSTISYNLAVDDFRRARRHAAAQEFFARLTGEPTELLSYEEVRRALHVRGQTDRGLQEIPLDAIVGSVGRYRDFTRGFLPRSDALQRRWATVKTVATSQEGWPPIDVYQIGEIYFVLDGNHRVSVARELGMTHIMARVTEVLTTIPLRADESPDELICRARYAAFLDRTGLGERRPDVELQVTAPGAYRVLEEHIAVHRYYLGLEEGREIPLLEAAASWVDRVYLPAVRLIRERGLLHDFPDRTETDLYIWLAEHRAELQQALGWEIAPESAASDLAQKRGGSPWRALARVGGKVRDALLPEELEPGPPPGAWRTERLAGRQEDCLFRDILVPVSGEEVGWHALEEAFVVARQEGARLRGLHVLPAGTDLDTPAVHAIKEEFAERCRQADVAGDVLVETGRVDQRVVDRARWNDLVVLNQLHPPGPSVLARLDSGLRKIIQRCPRPILVTPGRVSPLERPLLAYDGSPKADEALFLAAYLAGRWGRPLVVVAVGEPPAGREDPLERAGRYLAEYGVPADRRRVAGEVADGVLATAEAISCDLVLMGGYGASGLVEVVLGSSANEVLRRAAWPVLICG